MAAYIFIYVLYLIQICSVFSNLLVEIILLGDNSLHEKDSQNTVFVNLSKFWVYILVMTKIKTSNSRGLNINQTFKRIKKWINLWKFKTLAIPKLMLSVIPVPKQLIKEQTQYFTILYRMGKIKWSFLQLYLPKKWEDLKY